jgi:hypothetical protein
VEQPLEEGQPEEQPREEQLHDGQKMCDGQLAQVQRLVSKKELVECDERTPPSCCGVGWRLCLLR